MDVFNSVDTRIPTSKAKHPAGQNQSDNSSVKKGSRRKQVTDQQIREKLAARFKDAKVDISKKARNHPGKGQLDPEEIQAFSDIGNNDPNNDMTHDKLKKILESGGFNFNEKERAALEEILFRS